MSKNGFLISLLASVATATLGLGGCSIQNTPHSPTFESDIKEITASRCVRCHGAGGKLNADPKAVLAFPPFDGFFDRMEDDCPDGEPRACHGLGFYATNKDDHRLHDFIHQVKGAQYPMPPAPAPKLTADQLDIFDLWLANGAPAQ